MHVLPANELICACVELYAVGHFEWVSPGEGAAPHLAARLDGLELVDLVPTGLEDMVECYLTAALRLGILPRLLLPIEKLTLDLGRLLAQQGLVLDKGVVLRPTAVPQDVPHNPALEDDRLKAFLDLTVSDLED